MSFNSRLGTRFDGLSDGQLVTLLIGIGLELSWLHAAGRPFGPVHPTHITIDARGRPGLHHTTAGSGGAIVDDTHHLLRLGAALGSESGAVATACRDRDQSGALEQRIQGMQPLMLWLLALVPPAPLPTRLRSSDPGKRSLPR